MPAKQTGELIEFELAENERDQVIQALRDVAQNWEKLEEHLQKLEAQVGLPRFYLSNRVIERLAAVLDDVKKDLEEQTQADASALAQLMNILDGRRGH
jgi:hypothetical protein